MTPEEKANYIKKFVEYVDIEHDFRLPLLIETGTYYGDMIQAQLENFDYIISIELGYDLFCKAVKRFENNKNVLIINGDSRDV